VLNEPIKAKVNLYITNKKERYSRVLRLSDTRYSAIGTKGKWRYAISQYMIMWAVDRF